MLPQAPQLRTALAVLTHAVGFATGQAVSPALHMIPQVGGVPVHLATPPAAGARHSVLQLPQ
jgi:hypothetical protein